jgi:Ca2+/H+ antiporter
MDTLYYMTFDRRDWTWLLPVAAIAATCVGLWVWWNQTPRQWHFVVAGAVVSINVLAFFVSRASRIADPKGFDVIRKD